MNKTVKKIYKHKNIPAEFHDITLSIEDSYYFAQPHWHNGIEILFITNGTAETLIDDKVIRETAGDIVLVNADTLHSTRAVTDNTKYYCLILRNTACEEFGFSANDLYIQTKINDSRLFSMVNELCEEFAEERKYYTAVITAKILEIVAILLRNYSFEKKCTKPKANVEAIKKGLKYIEANFAKQITVDDIAKNAGYSKYHFCRCFNEITKSTVNSYINRLRINHAVRLLSEQGLSVSETASECGFNDISYFTKTFKKYTSQLPSHFKTDKFNQGTT